MQTKTLSFGDYKVGRGKKQLLTVGNTIEMKPGLHVLVAPNGIGKSTFFQTMAGVIPTQGGKINYSPQEIFYASEYLSFPRYVYGSEWISFKTKVSDVEEKSKEYVKKLRLEEPWTHYLGRMSQGERRKVVWIAAALSSANLVLLDEPFHGLDLLALPEAEKMIVEWIEARNRIVWVIDHQWRPLYGNPRVTPQYWLIKEGVLQRSERLMGEEGRRAEGFFAVIQDVYR